MKLETCQENHLPLKSGGSIKPFFFTDQTYLNWSNIFKVLGDQNRLKILILLSQNERLCVCELTFLLAISQPLTSQQLKALKAADLIDSEKEGNSVYYFLANSEVKQFIETLNTTDLFEKGLRDV